MTDFITEATQRMVDDGLIIAELVTDGQLHRCGVQGKERSKSGAYLIHADGLPVAWWRNWRADIEGTYSDKQEKDLPKKERKAFQERMAAMKAAARLDAEARHKEAADRAAQEWEAAIEATNEHPYLRKKEVGAFGLRLDGKDRLLMPILDEDGKIVSLQRILPKKLPDGRDKSFLPGGQKKGCYFPIPAKDGGKDGPLLIAEGYATAASLHMATGHAVLVAMDAGNLLAVAKMARMK